MQTNNLTSHGLSITAPRLNNISTRGRYPLRAATYKAGWTPCRVRTVSVTFIIFKNDEAIHMLA